ncbi:Rrf2 family transcriptional regulator, partial [uncultured Dubosiella sp.]
MIRKTDYALRILRTLSDGGLYSMKALCASECIPQPFAYKIVALLRNAGLVQSLPGSKGGCRLAGDLRDFT